MTSENRRKPKIPVTLLTGFLGSGKTTLLSKLLQHPEFANTLVIINEFGEVGIDHALLVEAKEDAVLELSSGCMCCSIRGDLKRTLQDAPWRYARGGKRWFERVVMETTGLADPLPVMHTLMKDEKVRTLYELAGVVTCVDAAAAQTTLARQPEAVRQIAVADMVLLTKTDIVDRAVTDQVKAQIREINPACPLQVTVDGVIAPDVLTDPHLHMPIAEGSEVAKWLNAAAYDAEDAEDAAEEAEEQHHCHDATCHCHDHHHEHHDDHGHHHHHGASRHDSDIHADCITIAEPLRREVFDQWLELLTAARGPDMLRLKGLVNIKGEPGPLVLHGVQHTLYPPQFLEAWPDEDHTSRIVFIGRNLPVEDFKNGLALLKTNAVRNLKALYESPRSA